MEVKPKTVKQASETRVDEIVIPERISTYIDVKTGARTLALPFQFADGVSGVLMICRLSSEEWIPAEKIEKIQIHLVKK